MNKLNVASGEDIKSGWDNLDKHNRYGANIIWDLNNLPLPFENESYDYILCSYFLEHINNCFPLMNEFVRILKPDGQLEILVPYGDTAWDSINHNRQFFLTTFFDFLTDNGFEDRGVKNMKMKSYYFISSKKKFKVWLFNKLIRIHYKIIDKTFLRFFTSYLNIKIIYKKENESEKGS